MRIKMRNWMSWADHELVLAGACNFVVGVNGLGKTSVRDAIEFALLGTGRLRGKVTTKGELASMAIRDDADSCEVRIEVEGLRIRRTMDRLGSQELFRSTWTDGRWTDEDPVALSRGRSNAFFPEADDVVRCMLEPTHLFTLEGQRRHEILVQATSGGRPSREDAVTALMAALTPQGPADIEAIQDAAGWVSELGFRDAEGAAVEKRRDAKRDLALHPEVEHPETPEGINSDVPSAAHAARLAELRKEHTAAVALEAAGSGALTGKLLEATEARDAIMNAPPYNGLAAEEAARKVLDDTLAALEATSNAPNEDVAIELNSHVEAHEAALQGVSEAALVRTSLESEVRKLEATVGARATFDRPDECPIGPPGMRCAAKPSQWDHQVERSLADPAAVEGELDRLRGELTDAVVLCDERRDVAEAAAAKIADTKRLLAGVREALDARLMAEAASVAAAAQVETLRGIKENAQERLAQRVVEANERVNAAQAELDGAIGTDVVTSPTAADLAVTITRGEAAVLLASSFEREVALWKEVQDKRQACQEIIDRWDEVCQQLKPTGIETKLGGGARDAFVKSMETFGPLSGQLVLDDDAGLAIEVLGHKYPRHPLQLSTSQRMAVGVAIQHALCQLYCFPIFVVDALDVFDGTRREIWAEIVAALPPESYPGGIVGLATITKDPTTPPAPWQTVWIQPGGAAVVLSR